MNLKLLTKAVAFCAAVAVLSAIPTQPVEAVPTCALTCASRAILYGERNGWTDNEIDNYYISCAIKACDTSCKWPDCAQA